MAENIFVILVYQVFEISGEKNQHKLVF